MQDDMFIHVIPSIFYLTLLIACAVGFIIGLHLGVYIAIKSGKEVAYRILRQNGVKI